MNRPNKELTIKDQLRSIAVNSVGLTDVEATFNTRVLTPRQIRTILTQHVQYGPID